MSSSTPPDWGPPRCIHGNIILGCPHDDCPTQLAYLDQQEAAMRAYHVHTITFFYKRPWYRGFRKTYYVYCLFCGPL